MFNYTRVAVLLCTRDPVSLTTEHMVSLCLRKLLGGWIRTRILFTEAGLKHCSS